MDRAERIGKTVYAILIIIFLIGYSAGNFYHARVEILDKMAEIRPESIKDDIAAVNNMAVETMLWRYPFIECFGMLQLVQGKHEINSFDKVKDKAGYLHSSNFWVGFNDDSKELAVRVRRLQDLLAVKGTQVCFVMSPMKTVRKEVQYTGIPYNDFNEQADEVMRWLRYYEVPCLDLRQSLMDAGLSYEETFYKTDHHWTAQAAFIGFCDLIKWFNETFETDLDPNGFYCDINNYQTRTYKNTMLGSQGRDTGVCYAEGMEDFTALIPRDEGDYNWIRGDLKDIQDLKVLEMLETLEDADAVNQQAGLHELKGTDGLFTETLLKLPSKKPEGEKIYQGVAENAYMEGIVPYDFIKNNHYREDGPSFLFLRDSYASPVITFFVQCVPQVEALWTGQYNSEIMETFLSEKDYDYVIIMLYPENLQFDFFPFCESEN